MCTPYMNKLDISCTWKTANGRSIKDTITFGNINDESSELDLSDFVSFETCVQLINPSSSTCTPMLSFNFTSDYNISTIKIISEARVIELYGRDGEYITTSQSEFVDDFEGMAVYSTSLKLNIPSFECSLKFKKLKNVDNFWLYGVRIDLDPCPGIKSNDPQVNLKSITDRLQLSQCPLSSNAEQCLRLLQEFQTGANGELKRPSFSRLPEGVAQGAGLSDISRKMCNLLLNASPGNANLKELRTVPSSSASPLPHTVDKESFSSSDGVEVGGELRTALDEQFQKLECKLMAKIDARLDKMEEKLNLLMAMLHKNVTGSDLKEENEIGKALNPG